MSFRSSSSNLKYKIMVKEKFELKKMVLLVYSLNNV